MKNISVEQISAISKAISHPERTHIVELLCVKQCNVTEIVNKTGIAQPKVSGHLSRLQSAGIVDSMRIGKEIVYSVIPERLETLSSWIENLSGMRNRDTSVDKNHKELPYKPDFSNARCCYDHLAGKAGVWLLEELLKRSWIMPENMEKPTFRLTDVGISGFQNLGIEIPIVKKYGRMFAYGCVDVSERQFHLGGSLGYVIFKDMLFKGIISKTPGNRTLIINRPIEEWFNDSSLF
ncbi:MAG: ArsR/SmtB family transcription factor [Thermoplasmataceae archaeon]